MWIREVQNKWKTRKILVQLWTKSEEEEENHLSKRLFRSTVRRGEKIKAKMCKFDVAIEEKRTILNNENESSFITRCGSTLPNRLREN